MFRRKRGTTVLAPLESNFIEVFLWAMCFLFSLSRLTGVTAYVDPGSDIPLIMNVLWNGLILAGSGFALFGMALPDKLVGTLVSAASLLTLGSGAMMWGAALTFYPHPRLPQTEWLALLVGTAMFGVAAFGRAWQVWRHKEAWIVLTQQKGADDGPR